MNYKKNKKPDGITLAQVRRGVLPKQYRHDKKIVEAFAMLHFLLSLIVVKHPRVALDMPADMLGKIESMFLTFAGITDNVHGWFATLPADPTPPQFKTILTTFGDCQKDVLAKVPGAKNARDAAYSAALLATQSWQNYVQRLCNLNPDHAKEIAGDAHMILNIVKGREKNDCTATSTLEGQVELGGIVRCNRQATDWEMSTDPTDPLKWYVTKIPPTLAANTIVTGITSNAIMYFRSRVILMEGPQEWSVVIKVRVK